MLGSLISAGLGFLNAGRQEKLQKEFAQNSISWKAADAERAGISKVFAMGAPTISYAPSSVGDMGFGDAGKAVGKSIEGQGGAGSTTGGKLAGISNEIQRAQLDGLKIDNDIKRAELASKISIASQAGVGGVGQGAVDTIPGTPDSLKLQAQRQPSGATPELSYGVSPEVDLYRTKHGFAPQVPQNLQESFESDHVSYFQWLARNKILPYFNSNYMSPPYQAEPGNYGVYSPLLGEYIKVPRTGDAQGPTHHHKWYYLMDKLRR